MFRDHAKLTPGDQSIDSTSQPDTERSSTVITMDKVRAIENDLLGNECPQERMESEIFLGTNGPSKKKR